MAGPAASSSLDTGVGELDSQPQEHEHDHDATMEDFRREEKRKELSSGSTSASTSPSRSQSGHHSDDSGSRREKEKTDRRAGRNSDEEQENAEDDEYMVGYDGDDDPKNPRNMSSARKWLIVLIVSSCATCVTAASSIYTTTYDQIMPHFHISKEVATVGLSLFVAGLGLGPLFLSPMSEFYGRRPVYIVSIAMFLIWLVPCAVANGIAALFIGRFLTGLAGSVFLSVAGGTVGDLFTGAQLSAPMMVFTSSPFIGPEVGPLVGGFISQYTDWRWTFYVMIIWTAVELALIVFLVPETYEPAVLRRIAQRKRKDTGNEQWTAPIERENASKSMVQVILWSCIRPFQLLVLEPMVANLCLLSALLLGIIYLFFGAFALIFEDVYGFSLWGVGLSFLGMLVGMLLAVAGDPIWTWNYKRLTRRLEARGAKKGATEPEFRLPPTVAGACLVPVGLFGFAWTTYPHVHWIVPIFFSGIFGLGTVWVYHGCFTFLVHSYPRYAASALAANSFARASLAAAFPLFGTAMYQNLGYNWASSLLGFLALAMAPFPYIFYRYGKKLRAKSRFAEG